MTKPELQRLGLNEDATDAEISARLDQLSVAESKAAELDELKAKPQIDLGGGVMLPSDIDVEDVQWRIQAGLLPHQAIQVVRLEKKEAAMNARDSGRIRE